MMNELSDTDAAWLAGWLCADGSILPGPPPKIRWVICDRDVLERIAVLVGRNKVHGPYPPSGLGKKDRFEWAISGADALALGVRLKPWLSERYLARLAEANRCWQPKKHLGRVLTPADAEVIRNTPKSYGSGRMLARRFGVSEGLIGHIRSGRVWGER